MTTKAKARKHPRPLDISERCTMDTPSTPSEPEQALAVFNHAGEEIRFFKGQQWHVTNYALLAYGALAAAPTWMATWEAVASGICAALVAVPAWMATRVLRSLEQALEKERKRMGAARSKLPLIAAIHDEFGPVDRKGRKDHNRDRSEVSLVLWIAVVLGALLAILISLSRIPWARVAALIVGP